MIQNDGFMSYKTSLFNLLFFNLFRKYMGDQIILGKYMGDHNQSIPKKGDHKGTPLRIIKFIVFPF